MAGKKIKKNSQFRVTLNRLKRNRMAMVGLFIILVMI